MEVRLQGGVDEPMVRLREILKNFEEHEWYLEGIGPATKPEPALLSVISESLG